MNREGHSVWLHKIFEVLNADLSAHYKKQLQAENSGNAFPTLLMGRFSVLLDIIQERGLEKQIDIWKIVRRVIELSKFPDFVFNDPEKYMIALTQNLKQGIIWPDIRFPVIPAKQKEFSIREVSMLARRTERTIRSDLDTEKLRGEKVGRRWIIHRKALLSYLRHLKKA